MLDESMLVEEFNPGERSDENSENFELDDDEEEKKEGKIFAMVCKEVEKTSKKVINDSSFRDYLISKTKGKGSSIREGYQTRGKTGYKALKTQN